DAEGSELVSALSQRARAGDTKALRVCLDRVLPRGLDRPVQFALPRIECVEDARRAGADIVEAVASGELTPREADGLLRVVSRLAAMLCAMDAAELTAILKAS